MLLPVSLTPAQWDDVLEALRDYNEAIQGEVLAQLEAHSSWDDVEDEEE